MGAKGRDRLPNFPQQGGKEVLAMDAAIIVIFVIAFSVLLTIARNGRS